MKSNVTAAVIFLAATVGGVVIFWLGRRTGLAQASLGACVAAIIVGGLTASSVASNLDVPADQKKSDEERANE